MTGIELNSKCKTSSDIAVYIKLNIKLTANNCLLRKYTASKVTEHTFFLELVSKHSLQFIFGHLSHSISR